MMYKIFNSVFPERIEVCYWTMGKGRRFFFYSVYSIISEQCANCMY